jgi:SAM-dependent methyltransferase
MSGAAASDQPPFRIGALGWLSGRGLVQEPGRQWARAAGTSPLAEEQWRAPAEPFDLIVAVGTLDTVNPLPAVLMSLRTSLRPDSLLIGAMAGGESLPRLRSAMQAADRVLGAAAPHVHPRIEASALAALLSAAGFIMPVVDVDRVRVSYPSLQRLVGDLRRMGATNVLAQRPRTPLLRAAREAAGQAFTAAGKPVEELFEILHFAAWTPTEVGSGR